MKLPTEQAMTLAYLVFTERSAVLEFARLIDEKIALPELIAERNRLRAACQELLRADEPDAGIEYVESAIRLARSALEAKP